MRYYLSETPLSEKHAGSKARVDADAVIGEFFTEFTHIEIKKYDTKLEKLLDKISPKYLFKLLKCLTTTNEEIILQYPFYFDKITNKILKRFAMENRTILLLHDVDSLRSFGEISVKNEIDFFNKMEVLIVHNSSMKKGLENLGVKTKMVELKCFDYLLNKEIAKNFSPKRELSKEIAFPGNLVKSEFLKDEEIEKIGVNFHLYGGENPNLKAKNLSYMGGFAPDVIPTKLTESFGLIWDGDTIKTCGGDFGKYLSYNNPHKMSLYIASLLPVIVWENAAAAAFVTKYNIGFTIKSLFEIPEKINAINVVDYDNYIKNLKPLREKVINGEFLRGILKKIK